MRPMAHASVAPQDLLAMAEAFGEKRARGEVHGHGSGFGGSGFKFDAAEADHRKAERKVRIPQAHGPQ